MLLPPVCKLKAGKRLYTATGPNLHQAGCCIWEVMNTSKFTSWPVGADCSVPKFLERDKQMGQERIEFWMYCIAVEITSEFICSLSLMLKTIRSLKLSTVSSIFCELTGQTLSYSHVGEVFKTQMKSRDTCRSYVCFVYDVSSVFFWWGNTVSEMQEISLQLGWSLCFLFAFGHFTFFPEDEAWKMRLHVSFCIYIYFQMPGA